MKILIVSDTHKDNRYFYKALDRERPLDMVIHCGDIGGNEGVLESQAACPFYVVAGNTDYYSPLPRDLLLEVEGYRIFVTHGHNYYVNSGNEVLKEYALEKGANVAFYGHTHVPEIDEQENITLVNPGSLSFPRQNNGCPSYAIMMIDKKGKASFEIYYF